MNGLPAAGAAPDQFPIGFVIELYQRSGRPAAGAAPSQFPIGFVIELYQRSGHPAAGAAPDQFPIGFVIELHQRSGRPAAGAAPGQFPIGFVLELYQRSANPAAGAAPGQFPNSSHKSMTQPQVHKQPQQKWPQQLASSVPCRRGTGYDRQVRVRSRRALARAAQEGAKMARGWRPEAQGSPGRDAGAAREGASATQQSLCREPKSSPAT